MQTFDCAVKKALSHISRPYHSQALNATLVVNIHECFDQTPFIPTSPTHPCFITPFLNNLEPNFDVKHPKQTPVSSLTGQRKELEANKQVVYPKVKVRQEPYQENDDGDVRNLGLKSFLSLSSPVMDKKNVIMRSVVKVPKCYVPNVPTPRVPVTEDFGDCSLTSDSSGSEKDGNTDENKVRIRASSIPRPRAVISSPENDIMIGNVNKIRDGRLPASKNGTVLQNRHAQCKVKSHDVTDIPADTRKSKKPESNDKIDPVGRKKVHKGSRKTENVPREWKF